MNGRPRDGAMEMNEGSTASCLARAPLASLCFLLILKGLETKGALWGGEAGSICHLAFSLVLQCLGVSRYPYAGKNSTKYFTVTPLFVCPKC